MKVLHYHDITVDICEETGGVWFDLVEFGRFIKRFPEVLPNLELSATKTIESKPHIFQTRICPNDQSPLEPYSYIEAPNVPLDDCPLCGGLWFDDGEIGEVLDTVDKRIAYWVQNGMPPEVVNDKDILPLLEAIQMAKRNRARVSTLLRVLGAYNRVGLQLKPSPALAEALRVLNADDEQLSARTPAPVKRPDWTPSEPSKPE